MDNRNLRVLVVEDEELLLDAIVRKLTSSGLRVVSARSGGEAFKILREGTEKPDIIWLDYYLSDMNGIEFMNELKKDEDLIKIPTIVVSNSASDTKVTNMMNFGVKKYFLKAEKRLDEIIDFVKDYYRKEGS